MKNLDAMLHEGARKSAAADALAPTAPSPSAKEIARQHMLIGELFKRIDALSEAMVRLGAMPPPNVVNNLPEMRVTVEAPEVEVAAPNVTVEAPTVNVAAPTVNVEAPTVNVEAPNVTVNPPQVHVAAPSVTMDAPNINVASPNINIPEIVIPYPKRLTFQHYYDANDNLVETTVTATE